MENKERPQGHCDLRLTLLTGIGLGTVENKERPQGHCDPLDDILRQIGHGIRWKTKNARKGIATNDQMGPTTGRQLTVENKERPQGHCDRFPEYTP